MKVIYLHVEPACHRLLAQVVTRVQIQGYPYNQIPDFT